jgi:hypothetical protein
VETSRKDGAPYGSPFISPRRRPPRGQRHPAEGREPVSAAGPEPAAANGRLHVLDGHADRRADDHRRWGRRETYSGRSGKWRQPAGRFDGRSLSRGSAWLTRSPPGRSRVTSRGCSARALPAAGVLVSARRGAGPEPKRRRSDARRGRGPVPFGLLAGCPPGRPCGLPGAERGGD